MKAILSKNWKTQEAEIKYSEILYKLIHQIDPKFTVICLKPLPGFRWKNEPNEGWEISKRERSSDEKILSNN